MKEIPITKEVFFALVDYLKGINIYQHCDCQTLFYTKQFLKERGFSQEEINKICDFFRNRGGYCDCEVLLNVIHEIFSNEKDFYEYINKAQAAVNK